MPIHKREKYDFFRNSQVVMLVNYKKKKKTFKEIKDGLTKITETLELCDISRKSSRHTQMYQTNEENPRMKSINSHEWTIGEEKKLTTK